MVGSATVEGASGDSVRLRTWCREDEWRGYDGRIGQIEDAHDDNIWRWRA